MLLSVMVTAHHPETAADTLKRAKEAADARNREIEELEVELKRITELAQQAQSNDSGSTSSTELTGDWSGTPHENVANTLRDQTVITVTRGPNDSVTGIKRDKKLQHTYCLDHEIGLDHKIGLDDISW
jgi:hypothetical protein